MGEHVVEMPHISFESSKAKLESWIKAFEAVDIPPLLREEANEARDNVQRILDLGADGFNETIFRQVEEQVVAFFRTLETYLEQRKDESVA